MKKICLLLLAFLPCFIFSQSISKAKLIEYGITAYQQKSYAITQNIPNILLTDTKYIVNETDTLIGIFKFGDQGFIIMSAEETAYPVLGYSIDNDIDFANLAPGLQYWLEVYQEEIQMIKNGTQTIDEKTAMEWNKIKMQDFTPSRVVVQPYLFTARWNQSRYYNQYSPKDPASPSGYDGKCPNGCVAVAMAQIMYYYRFPQIGQGSHTNHTYEYGDFYVNFAQQNYNYNAMSDALNTYNNEVAKLIFHCATSVDMMYAPDGSGAYSQDVPAALSTYFKYQNDVQMISKSSFTYENWKIRLRQDLDNGKPIYYSGHRESGGHAFVCDGYDGEDLFHFNFGWGGSSNGYFYVNNSDQAAGGFHSSQNAIVNIYPSNSEPYPTFCNSEPIVTDASYGTLEDGSRTEPYQDNSNCLYIIAPTTHTFITIDLQYLRTEPDHDSLSFWNGHPEHGGSLLATYSGIVDNQSIDFYVDSLFITFKTNSSITDDGWRLSYRAVGIPHPCYGSEMYREPSGIISDGSDDHNYYPCLNCFWNIVPDNFQEVTSLTVNFLEFDLSPEDWVSIIDLGDHSVLLDSYTGSTLPATKTYNTNLLRISFSSDSWKEKSGFKLHYYTNLVANITDNNAKNDVIVFPNPAKEEITIQLSEQSTSDWQLSIFDMTGRQLLAKNVSMDNQNRCNLNVSVLASGIYLIKISSDSQIFTQKLIVN